MSSSKSYPFLVFLAVAFLIGLPAFFIAALQTPAAIQVLLFILGSYGTTFAVWVALMIFHSADELHTVQRRLRVWRASPMTYLITIGLPTIVWLLAILLNSWQALPQSIPWIGLLFFPIVFLTNFGEEIGWRGFALPHLMASLRPVTASLILGLIWGVFHLPLYWHRPLFAVLFLALTPALSIFMTWLFVKTGGSVLLTTLFHAAYNTWGQVLLPVGGDRLMAITVGLMWAVAVFLVIRYDTSLSRTPIPSSVLGVS